MSAANSAVPSSLLKDVVTITSVHTGTGSTGAFAPIGGMVGLGKTPGLIGGHTRVHAVVAPSTLRPKGKDHSPWCHVSAVAATGTLATHSGGAS